VEKQGARHGSAGTWRRNASLCASDALLRRRNINRHGGMFCRAAQI